MVRQQHQRKHEQETPEEIMEKWVPKTALGKKSKVRRSKEY